MPDIRKLPIWEYTKNIPVKNIQDRVIHCILREPVNNYKCYYLSDGCVEDFKDHYDFKYECDGYSSLVLENLENCTHLELWLGNETIYQTEMDPNVKEFKIPMYTTEEPDWRSYEEFKCSLFRWTMRFGTNFIPGFVQLSIILNKGASARVRAGYVYTTNTNWLKQMKDPANDIYYPPIPAGDRAFSKLIRPSKLVRPY